MQFKEQSASTFSTISPGIADPGHGHTVNFTVKELHSNTAYNFRVIVMNNQSSEAVYSKEVTLFTAGITTIFDIIF